MLSLPHLIVLFLIALVVFGPEKLPELARMLGKATAEMRKMTSDFRFALEDEMRDLDRQARIREEETAMRNTRTEVGTIHGNSVPRTPAITPFPTGEENQFQDEPPVHVESPANSESSTPAHEPAVLTHPDEKAPDDPTGV